MVPDRGMPERRFPSLDELIRDIESQTASRPELAEILAVVIRMMVASDADPYLLLGVLTEGIAHTIASRIPEDEQADTAEEALSLLQERLEANGLH